MMTSLIAICLGGLEDVVIADLKKVVPSTVDIIYFAQSKARNHGVEINGKWVNQGEGGCGKIILHNVENFDFIHCVRSVQHWLVYIAQSRSLTLDSGGIDHIQSLAENDANFTDSLTAWKQCLSIDGKYKYADIINGRREPTFCVRCIRDGDHKFSSLDVARKLGESVLSKTQWTVDLCNMDFEIIAFILSETLLIGINIPTLSPPFLKSRLPGEVRPPVVPSGLTSGLRPSTAYLLVQLARPEVGDVVVDAMCGCGATFIEAAYGTPVVALGGDVDSDLQFTLLESMRQTKEMSKNKAVEELAWWGAPRLPLRDGAADIAVLDLPFGKVSKKVPKYYSRARVPKHVAELARVLRPGTGRCVFLIQSHQHLISCLDSVYFTDTRTIGVNIGGFVCSVVVAQRTERVFQESLSAALNEVEKEGIVGKKRGTVDLSEE